MIKFLRYQYAFKLNKYIQMYTPVIGLEIHVQVKTKSKMFCSCSSEYFGAEPNTHICPVCFGLSGALPVPNRVAVEKTFRLALALNCQLNQKVKFDRKNYFYPDIPKGYQISQFDMPIGFEGSLVIPGRDESDPIRIQRVHLEEDTAKSTHDKDDETLVDFNKSGVALIEIVTKPDFRSTKEVLDFAKRLRQIVKYIDISDAEMQKGQMRFELNISLQKEGETELPDYKVEVKNIGSISVLEKVINFEIGRQSKLLDEGNKLKQETRGVKDMSGVTLEQRSKEFAADYRYFPEQDIPPVTISDAEINAIRESMPELPAERLERYIELGLTTENAEILIEDTDRGNYFESILESSTDVSPDFVKELFKWINTDLSGLLQKRKLSFSNSNVKAEDLMELINLVLDKKISGTNAKKVLEQLVEANGSGNLNTWEIVEKNNMLQSEDLNVSIDEFVTQAIKQNPKVVETLAKNPNAIKFLVGQVMKLSGGKANPIEVEEALKQKLGM